MAYTVSDCVVFFQIRGKCNICLNSCDSTVNFYFCIIQSEIELNNKYTDYTKINKIQEKVKLNRIYKNIQIKHREIKL